MTTQEDYGLLGRALLQARAKQELREAEELRTFRAIDGRTIRLSDAEAADRLRERLAAEPPPVATKEGKP